MTARKGWTELPPRFDVHARLVSSGTSVELVQVDGSSGEASEGHKDAVLCRYLAPSHIRAVTAFGRNPPQPVGPLLFVPPGVFNRVEGPNEPVSAILCRFDQDWLSRRIEIPVRWSEDITRRCADVRSESADKAMLWLATELSRPNSSSMIIRSLIDIVIIELSRYLLPASRSCPRVSSQGRLTPSRLLQIENIVRSTIPRPRIAEIAAACETSPVHLRRLFKASTGRTLQTYIDEMRIERAKELLANTDRSVNDIAQALGFAYSSNFAAAFRRIVGRTALQYRFLRTAASP